MAVLPARTPHAEERCLGVRSALAQESMESTMPKSLCVEKTYITSLLISMFRCRVDIAIELCELHTGFLAHRVFFSTSLDK